MLLPDIMKIFTNQQQRERESHGHNEAGFKNRFVPATGSNMVTLTSPFDLIGKNNLAMVAMVFFVLVKKTQYHFLKMHTPTLYF